MRYPLRYVIPIMLLVIGLLAAAAIALTSLRMSHDNSERFITEFLTTIGNQAASDVAAGLRRNNPARFRNAIEQLQVLRGIKLALLVDNDGVVVHSSIGRYSGKLIATSVDPQLAAIVTAARDSGRQLTRIAGNVFYYANHIANTLPLSLGGSASGHVLLITYDMADAQAGESVVAINQALIIGVTVLALSILSWIFLSNALFSRMSRLVEASRRIGAGHLRTPIQIDGNDEIAVLGKALDTMRVDLSEKQSQLVMAAEDLEAANDTVEQERALLAARIQERTRDLTAANAELARAKEAAEAASRAKSSFLATVSHEIRTPMNGVLGAMELLERTGMDETRAPLLHTAQESARSLLGLLNDLLDMAKIEAGRIELVRAPASVQTIVDQVIATHTPLAVEQRTILTGAIDADAPAWLTMDAMRVQQVLGNIVSNAVKFTEGGTVNLQVSVARLAASSCSVRFIVTDNGAGIPADTLAKLFRPFEQGAVEVARKSGGTGLGLAICRGLADRMGGTVTLDSEPGKGTTACFEIPATLASAPLASESKPVLDESTILELQNSDSCRSKKGVHILVVDDHPTNRMLQIRQIEQLGAISDTASDGLEALELLQQHHYDIVVTDCEMPNMDGFALARAIRESNKPYRNVPVIACTAHALPDIGERCLESGMNEVLTKPMRLDELATVLQRYWPSCSDLPSVPEQPVVEEPVVLDEQALELLTGGDVELRDSMMNAFLADLDRALDEIKDAVAASEYAPCKRIAHRNKGACAIFGALALGDAFAELDHWVDPKAMASESQIRMAVKRVGIESERLLRVVNESALTAKLA